MAKRVIDADTILNQAKPLTHQHAHEIQPFGHLVKLPIALAENVCRESVVSGPLNRQSCKGYRVRPKRRNERSVVGSQR
jgi:hypothetical protein